MIESLQRFVEDLRARGVRVSPAEVIDAARAADAVGPEDRARLRAALSATLAKTLRARCAFEETFETFFAPPARGGGAGGEARRGGQRGEGGGSGGPGSSEGAPGRGRAARPDEGAPRVGTSRPPRPGEPRPPSGSARRGIRALDASEIRRHLSTRSERSGQAPSGGEAEKRDPGRRRVSAAGGPARQRPALAVRDTGRGPKQAEPATQRPRLRRVLAVEAASPEGLPPGRGGAQAADRRRRDLAAPMTTDEERRLAEEIPKIVAEIRLRHSRRQRRAPRGRLWMKRAIRENLTTGGVPFRLPARAPRRRRPRVVLLVDVSRSVARAAGLFLALALEFLKLGRSARVFVFVDHPADATEALRAWLRSDARLRGPHAGSGLLRAGAAAGQAGALGLARAAGAGSAGPAGAGGAGSALERGSAPGAARVAHPTDRAGAGSRARPFHGRSPRNDPRRRGDVVGAGILSATTGRSFLQILGEVPGLDPGAPSDYGRTFYALGAGSLRTMGGRDAVLVVLGDGRTNAFDPLPWAFEELAGRARRVLWIVPEARARWGSEDSALPRYLPFCDVAVEARDLEGLAHGVREILTAL